MPAVATGFWIDHGRPPPFGATLTLKTSEANLLLSALTLLVTLGFASIWNLVAFFLHRFKAGASLSDDIDLQHRVLLRNSSTVANFIIGIAKLYAAWRQRDPTKLLIRTVGLVVPAVVVYAAFLASPALVAEIMNSTRDAVRIVPNFCGSEIMWQPVWTSPWESRRLKRARAYVDSVAQDSSSFTNLAAYFHPEISSFYGEWWGALSFPKCDSL